jgi:hypothetical protein
MILDFSKARFDPKKYFIYSDLLEDTGIECNDDDIIALCMLVNDPHNFIKKIANMDIRKKIEVYDFFDQYCVSKGIKVIIKESIKNCVVPAMDNFSKILFDDCISKKILRLSRHINIFTKDDYFVYNKTKFTCTMIDRRENEIEITYYDRWYCSLTILFRRNIPIAIDIHSDVFDVISYI